MWYILSGRFVNPEKTIFPRAYDDENPTVALTVCCVGAANEEVYTRFSENARPRKNQLKVQSKKWKVTAKTKNDFSSIILA
jgi:hypothetical protein